MFSSASSISGLTIASTSSFHGPGQPRASNSSAPPLESLSRFTPLTVNQAYAQRVPKHRSRNTDNFLFWFEVKKLHERFLDALTPNDMHAGFHQQFDGECAFPGQSFARKRERTLVPLALRNDEMMAPILFFCFSRRPCWCDHACGSMRSLAMRIQPPVSNASNPPPPR